MPRRSDENDEDIFITPSVFIRYVSGRHIWCPACQAFFHPTHAMSVDIKKACPRCHPDPEKIKALEARQG